MKNWQESCPVDFYFDFETINNQFVKSEIDINNSECISGIIFEIGIGWIENNVWNFKKFYIDQVNSDNEEEIIQDFFEFVLQKSAELDPDKKYYPRLFHWTNAEINNLRDANCRHGSIWNNLINETDILFVDMYKVFFDEKIGIKGALNYKLKTIGKALYNLGKITTTWPDTDITNGQIAMLEAAKYYKNKKNNCLN